MGEQKKYRVMVSGGGTGGHIYPAIAIANAIKSIEKDTEFLFVGAQGKMEMEKVPAAGFKIEGLWISGIRRSLTLDNLSFPFKLITSISKSFKLLKSFKPDVVIGVGGYASGPLLYAASKKSIPTLIQEQNGYAGLTNKWLAKKVNKICVAYDDMEKFFPADKIVNTGNPVRMDLLDTVNKKESGLAHFGMKNDKKTLLVLGGSLGARTINLAIVHGIEDLLHNGFQIIWQTGKVYHKEMSDKVSHLSDASLMVVPFLNEMDLAYGAADVVISRAGALSISELCLVGKPVIFVPSPNVTEDHQTKNAMALVAKDAALLISDKDAINDLSDAIIALMKDEKQCQIFSENIKQLAKPNAAKDIANEVLDLIK